MSIEETLKDPPKPLVIYHGNCADGFTAAWLFNIWYWQEVLRHDGQPNDWCVDGYPGVYGQSPPDVTGRRVYILDFSYPPETLTPMAVRAASITVIDHHKSAIERLEGFDMGNVKLILDDSRSGAYLTSLYLWPTREPSSMVEYVDDRDRWQFKLKNTRAFNAMPVQPALQDRRVEQVSTPTCPRPSWKARPSTASTSRTSRSCSRSARCCARSMASRYPWPTCRTRCQVTHVTSCW